MNPSRLNKEENRLREEISKYWWFHSIDLGNGVITAGHYDQNLPIAMDLLKGVDVSGLKCLDIGTMDGKAAFELEKRGAQVAAVDLEERQTVYFLLKHFNSSVQYIPNVHIEEIEPVLKKRGYDLFDLIVLSGVIYHIYSPLDAIISARRLIKTGGLFLIESACADSQDCSMHFNCGGRYYDDPTTFWMPSVGCLRYLLAFSCFEPIREKTLRHTKNVVRHAILARAKRPQDMNTCNDHWLYSLHRALPVWARKLYLPLDFNELGNSRPQINIVVPERKNAVQSNFLLHNAKEFFGKLNKNRSMPKEPRQWDIYKNEKL